jgi:hypothetical protein
MFAGMKTMFRRAATMFRSIVHHVLTGENLVTERRWVCSEWLKPCSAGSCTMFAGLTQRRGGAEAQVAQVHADRCSGQESGVGSQGGAGGRGGAQLPFSLSTLNCPHCTVDFPLTR